MLFKDLHAAEAWLGSTVVPSPLGNISKVKPDGTTKHRLITDLKASSVNAAAHVPERQVLPRGPDHAQDLADLQLLVDGRGISDDGVSTLILDFQNAFMTIPLAPEEMPFNCTEVGASIQLARPQLDDAEDTTGNFVVLKFDTEMKRHLVLSYKWQMVKLECSV